MPRLSGPHKAQGSQGQDPKGLQPQAGLAYIAHPKLSKHVHARIVKSVRLFQSKSRAKAQTMTQAVATATAKTPKGAQALREASVSISVEVSAGVKTEELV